MIDDAAGGAADGMRLAINVAAMLIAFLAFIAMIDFLLGLVSPGLSLARVFAVAFAPVAVLLGVPTADVPVLADLLGTKLVTNEFVAYVKLAGEYEGVISERSRTLATFALTGFANFGVDRNSPGRDWWDGADPTGVTWRSSAHARCWPGSSPR